MKEIMNDAEFQSLVGLHYENLYRFALSLSGREAEACDLTQQTFYRWAQRGFQLRDRSKAKTWLFTTLYREFLGSQRRVTKYPHVEIDSVEHELPKLEASAVNEMDGHSVMEALQSLDEAYRVPLTLFYLQQHSYLEIAAMLEIPIGTVMSRLSRGKAQLRARLTQTENPQNTPANIVTFPTAERRNAAHGQA
jgi:RNA polymerase sigma-70 factor (ECF subfamily)